MKSSLTILAAMTGMLFCARPSLAQDSSSPSRPLQVLLIAGGCCHDYDIQSKLLKEGIEQRIDASVTIVYNPSKGTDATFEIYNEADWAKGYDVVVHDECSASVTDKPYVNRILDAHRDGVPAVNLHCAMHSYRWGDFRAPVEIGADNAAWFEMIGVQSTGHGPQSPIEVSYTKTEHPITHGLQDWKTINEELYNNVRIFGNTQVLASGVQVQAPNKKELSENPNAEPRKAEAVVVWTNEFGPKKTKIFSTTLGHNNDTVGDARYLDLVTRGLLWATGNLTKDGKPAPALAK
jgi:type 1 glutamine amidotransferase